MIRIGILLAGALLCASHPQQQMLRSRVDVVLLDVLPTERGRVVSDLRVEDLEIRDNGVRQTVMLFSTDSASLGVYLLLDTSGSLSPKDLEHLRRGATAFVGTLRAGDELHLMTFSRIVKLHGTMTKDTISAVFDRLEPVGETALNDTLTAAFRLADRQNSLRPVVIAFSDGVDTVSWLTPRDVDEAARMSWSSFFAVTPGDAPPSRLEQIATLTGGEVLRLTKDLSSLPDVFLQIMERLRQRYLVGFSPSSSALGWHELDVRVRKPNVKVLARRGYLRR